MVSPLAMRLRQEEVSRYIATVTLQLEVTSCVSPQTAAVTLFGSRDQRLSLASAVVASSSNLDDALALASK